MICGVLVSLGLLLVCGIEVVLLYRFYYLPTVEADKEYHRRWKQRLGF